MDTLCGMKSQVLTDWLKEKGYPTFHAAQILHWIYCKGAESLEEMTNLSKELRVQLQASFPFFSIQKVRVVDSEDQETCKWLWKLEDASLVESVLISSDKRRTVCVSDRKSVV